MLAITQIENQLEENLKSILPLRSFDLKYILSLQVVDDAVMTQFIRVIFPEFKNNPFGCQQFLSFLDLATASSFGLESWIVRIIDVYEWLVSRRQAATFANIIQYVSCALEDGGDYSGSILVYLDRYGFERVVQR